MRIAIDLPKDAEALVEVARGFDVPSRVDLQENYRTVEPVAPLVQKIRHNLGHLHHHEKSKSVEEGAVDRRDRSLERLRDRIGVNAGSVAPDYKERFETTTGAIVACAVDHCALLDGFDFADYVVSIKDSDPRLVIDANSAFAEARPDVPIHLGVTEAGMPPEGIIKTRIAFEQLLARGIGDTLRVSLTVPFEDKGQEIAWGEILADVENGRFRSVPPNFFEGLNIIACPSCSQERALHRPRRGRQAHDRVRGRAD